MASSIGSEEIRIDVEISSIFIPKIIVMELKIPKSHQTNTFHSK